MKTSVQNVWLKKAGALVACSVFVGSSTPALANGWGGNLPVASSVPLGHFPTTPVHTPVEHSGAPTSPWSIHSAGTTNQNGHQPPNGQGFSNRHSWQNAGTQANLWHGQQFLSTLPHISGNYSAQSLFSGNNGSGLSGPSLQLDLTSTTASIVLGSNIFQGKQSVTVDLGGTREVFSVGAHVTAAEYVAIRQVLSGTPQSLTLNGQGAAVGGTFSINAVSSGTVSELVVPSGVTALDYASKSQSQTISGDVLNYGTIYGVAGRGQGNTVSLNAQDVINESGGLISTKVSSPLLSSLGGVLSPVNLSLSAVDDISNSGKIVSSGSISLVTINGSITNGLPASVSSGGSVATGSGVTVATIQAVHDVSLSTGSGNLTNNGLIASATGNININTATASNAINISASGGTFQALKGDISVRDTSYVGSSNINLNGGDYLSKNLNLYSGTGTIDGNVGQITGMLNTTAGADHLQAATATLLLGDNKVSGDPTFVNSGSDGLGGNIEIVGDNQFSEDVAIIAAGNITASVDGQIVDHGHNVTLVAGAKITLPNTSDDHGTVQGNTVSPPVVSGNALTNVTIDTSQGSVNGGFIDLSTSKVATIIDTSNVSGNAGNVTLVAFGSGPLQQSGGTITLAATSTINATGGGTGNGGAVTIIAGNTTNDTNTIQMGGVNTGGGSAGRTGGAIGIYTAAPTTSGATITFDTTGAAMAGNSFTAGAVSPFAGIGITGDLVTAPAGQSGVAAGTSGANGGNITIVAGASISTLNLLAFGGGGSGGDSVNLNGGAGGTGGNISVTSSVPASPVFAPITIAGQVNTSGGGGGGAGANATAGGTGGAGGNAGTISILQQGTSFGNLVATILGTAGGVFAAQGGAGGSASATTVGGGGGSYGGGGGGGSSGTGGIPGVGGASGILGIVGTVGGGAGGAGFFGGGGADVDGAGGGGGYTGGSAGGSAAMATAGSSSTGGNGFSAAMVVTTGGQLSGGQQGGQGVGTGVDGANIPTTIGGNTITLSSVGATSFGGAIAGQNVTIAAGGNLNFPGNVVGTTLVTINDGTGTITQASPGLAILTPALTINFGSTPSFQVAAGSSSTPLSTNAQSITITGDAGGAWISDSAASTNFNWSNTATAGTVSLAMTAMGASIEIASMPTGLSNVAINVGSPANGGTILFDQNAIILGSSPGSITLTASNLNWTNVGSAFIISANNSAPTGGSGGIITITTNQVNGSKAIAISNGPGQLNLSATSYGNAGTGGSISLIAPDAALSVDAGFLQVGFTSKSGAESGTGGSIVLNVTSIANLNSGALMLNANGAGTGGGGSISITTNTALPQSIGTGGDIALSAVNGGLTGTRQTGGTISFVNLGAGVLTVDPLGLLVAVPVGDGLTSVNGGSITLTSGSIVNVRTGSPLVLNVDGSINGNGGKISITETMSSPPAVLLGGPTGQFNFSAQGGTSGGNGGSVAFSTQGALQLSTDANGNVIGVDNAATSTYFSAAVNPAGPNGVGGSLTLTATSFVPATSIANTPLRFNVSGVGVSNGGSVRINQLFDPANPGAGLTIGKSQGDLEFIATNGATGTKGGSVTVIVANNATNTSTGTLFVDPTAISEVLSTKTDPNVGGGFIEVDAPVIAPIAGALVTAPTVLNVSGVGTGNGGSINFEVSTPTLAPVTIGTKGGMFELLASSGKTGGNGGQLIIASGGNLTVMPAGISVKAAGNGNGGFLSLSAFNLGAVTDGTEGNLIVTGALSVNGSGKGTGGTIGLNSNSTKAFDVGLTSKNANGVEGGLSLTGGNGGSLDITSVGTGGIIIQTALTSPNFVDIVAGNTSTGDVDINSTVGGTKTGDIIVTAASTNIIGSSSGKLVTSTTGVIDLTAGTDIRGITTTIKGITTTKQLQMVTTGLTANTTTGDIDINDAISVSSTMTIMGMNAGNSINFSCGGSFQTAGFTGGVEGLGAVSGLVRASVAGEFSPALLTPSITITAGDTVGLTSATPSVANARATHINDAVKNTRANPKAKNQRNEVIGTAQTASGTFGTTANFTASASSSGGSSAVVSKGGAIAEGNSLSHPNAGSSGTQPTSLFDISSDETGLIFIGTTVSTTLTGFIGKSTSSVIISNSGAGASVNGSALLSGKSVVVETAGGDIGAAGTGLGLQVSTTNLSINSGRSGNAYINNPGKTILGMTSSASNNVTITSAGGANISNLTTAGDINITTNGTTTIKGLISAGAIAVATTGATTLGNMSTTGAMGDGGITAKNTTGLLQTIASAQIYAQNGSILLENENVKSGSIVIGAGSDIETGTLLSQPL